MNDTVKVSRTVAVLSARHRVAAGMVELAFTAPRLATAARPGQFVMVGPLEPDSVDPFLSRPFSVYRVVGDKVHLLVAVVGRGTARLAACEPERTRLGLLGPLGNGFTVPPQARQLLLVGGGLGLAPLAFLAERQVGRGLPVRLLVGARRAQALPGLDWLLAQGVRVELATEDGSAGHRGTVVDLAAGLAGTEPLAERADLYLAACGPEPMLRQLHQLTRSWQARVEVSLENHMACGVGACLGCSRPLPGGGTARVCREGPVFAAGEVFS